MSQEFEPAPLTVAPLPVVPLPGDFHSGYSVARPGVISTIGVSSIVIAAISLMGGVVVMLISLTVSSLAAIPVTATAAPVVTPVAATELLDADGMPAAARAIVVDGLARVRDLSEAQRRQLDELLAEAGKNILPIAGGTAQEQIAANVSRSGHLTTNGADTDYFVLGNGRLELTDDRAVFFPSDGQPIIRANAINVPANPASTLQPDQIRSVIRAINRINGSRIKSAQVTAIIAALQNPGEQLITTTTDGSDPANEVVSASTDADSNLTLSTHHAATDTTAVLDVNGQMTSTFSGSVSTTGFMNSPPRFNRNAVGWTILLNCGQLGLAIYLLICGIFTLRSSSFVGRRMHWIYVGIKLPIAIAAGVVTYGLWSDFFTSLSAAKPAGVSPMGAIWFTLPAVLGLIYPVALIVLLNLRGVRGYYSAARYAA
jgi:hypothetical protein